jgi:hypothetical protein
MALTSPAAGCTASPAMWCALSLARSFTPNLTHRGQYAIGKFAVAGDTHIHFVRQTDA